MFDGGIRVYSMFSYGNFTEASVDDTYCLGFEFEKYKRLLMKDVRFLQFVIKSLTDKLFLFSPDESKSGNLKNRLMHYFMLNYKNKIITNMKDMALAFRISARHLQRALAELTSEGKILKIMKGVYCLANACSEME
jgi:hypothetical protein